MGRPWTLMASGSPWRPIVKEEAGFGCRDWNAGLECWPCMFIAEVAWSVYVRFRVCEGHRRLERARSRAYGYCGVTPGLELPGPCHPCPGRVKRSGFLEGRSGY